MSEDHAIAALRRTRGDDLAKLAEEHLKHDLRQSDRDTLRTAAQQFSTHATVGSLVGLGLGVLLAFRVRRARVRMFEAFKAREKPTHVQFADGRTEPIPDVTPLLRPSLFGDLVTYFFFMTGGLFIGGETGLFTGAFSAGRTVTQDSDTRDRIDTAFRKFKAEALRKEADKLDGGERIIDKIL